MKRILKNLAIFLQVIIGKILDIKYLDKSGQEFIYDLFLNKFIHINKYVRHNSLNYIVQLTCERNFKKNLHYIFKPKKIEDYSEKLYNLLPESEIPRDIIELQKELTETQSLLHLTK